MRHLLSVSDIVALTDVSQSTISRLVTNGYIEPAVAGGDGRGQGHKFTVMQATAIVYASQWGHRMTDPFETRLIELVSNMSEADLQRELRKGHSFCIPRKRGGLLWMYWKEDVESDIDIGMAYNAVCVLIDEREENERHENNGQRDGVFNMLLTANQIAKNRVRQKRNRGA